MWIASRSSWKLLGLGYERGDFDFDLGARIDQAGNVEQRRGREVSPQSLAPGSPYAGAGGLVFAAAGQVPRQANDMFGPGAGLLQQFDNPVQGDGDLRGHVRLIFALLVAPGLTGKDNPLAGALNRNAVRKTARLGPVGRLQGQHEHILPKFVTSRWPIP